MKKIFFSIIILLISKNIFADVDINKIDQNAPIDEPIKKEIISDEKDLYGYFKIGGSFLIQNVGVGIRSRNENSNYGNDISFNVNFSSIGLIGKVYNVIPSLKYGILRFSDSKKTSTYNGINFELGAFIPINERKTHIFPVPNIELVRGTERDNSRFSQFGINLLPATFAIVAIAADVSSLRWGGFGAAFGLLASTSIFTYTVGF